MLLPIGRLLFAIIVMHSPILAASLMGKCEKTVFFLVPQRVFYIEANTVKFLDVDMAKTVDALKSHPMELAWIWGRLGRHEEADFLLNQIRQEMLSESIGEVEKKNLGNHGGYRAKLGKKMSVLVKPDLDGHERHFEYSSVRKEVLVSILDQMIGTYAIPTTIAKWTGKFVSSVHYWVDQKIQRKRWFFQDKEPFGSNSEINFLMALVGYSNYEIAERNRLFIEIPTSSAPSNWERVFKGSSKAQKLPIKALIDLGSAFAGNASYHLPNATSFHRYAIRKSTYEKMRSITFEQFSKAFETYLPEIDIMSLYTLLQRWVTAFKYWDFEKQSLDVEAYKSFIKKLDHLPNGGYLHFSSWWGWNDVKSPPDLEKKFGR